MGAPNPEHYEMLARSWENTAEIHEENARVAREQAERVRAKILEMQDE